MLDPKGVVAIVQVNSPDARPPEGVFAVDDEHPNTQSKNPI